MNEFRFLLRSLEARRFSTLVTVLTVAVAVGLMLTLLTMRESGRQAFRRGSGNIDLLVSADPGPLVAVLNNLFYAAAPAGPIPYTQFEEIRGSFPWAWAIPMQQGDNYRGYPAVATTPAFFEAYEPVPGVPWRFAEGGPFERSFEMVLGSEVAARTGLSIGSEVLLTHGSGGSREGVDRGHVHKEYAFKVVGILAPSGSAHDRALFSDLDSSWIVHAHDRYEREGRHKLTSLEDVTDEDRLVTGILLKLPERGRGISAALPQQFDRLRRETGLVVAQPAQEVGRLLSIVGDIDSLLVAMAATVLLASGVGILLAMYNSMELRRRQVALIRVLGASRGRVFLLVLTESALIGLMGAAGGIILAGMGVLAVSSTLASRLGIVVPATLEPRLILSMTIATTLLAAIAGLLPAALAYRTPVAPQLRPII